MHTCIVFSGNWIESDLIWKWYHFVIVYACLSPASQGLYLRNTVVASKRLAYSLDQCLDKNNVIDRQVQAARVPRGPAQMMYESYVTIAALNVPVVLDSS